MKDAIASRVGINYAAIVCSIFSLSNLRTLESVIGANEVTNTIWDTMMSQLIGNYAETVMKQDSSWASYCQEEKTDKMKKFLQMMQTDLEMLDRNQKK